MPNTGQNTLCGQTKQARVRNRVWLIWYPNHQSPDQVSTEIAIVSAAAAVCHVRLSLDILMTQRAPCIVTVLVVLWTGKERLFHFVRDKMVRVSVIETDLDLQFTEGTTLQCVS